MRLTPMFAILTILTGCGFHAAAVPLRGVHSDIELLAGDWQGDYTGDDTRRAGQIMFRITAHGDSAYGDVQMFVPGYQHFPLPWDQPAAHLLHARSPEYLAIRFVTVGSGEVSGALEPYTSPDCDCVVSTRFTGRVRGNEISGRFITKGEGTPERVGRWQVKRATH